MTNYYLSYLKKIKKNLENIDYTLVEKLEKKILEIKKNKSKIIFFGNGGSAAISKHFAIDVLKNLKVRTLTFDHVQITCFSNDYGHKNWMKKSLEFNWSWARGSSWCASKPAEKSMNSGLNLSIFFNTNS